VLRGAEEHLAHRPHRRLAAHRRLGPGLEQALGCRQEGVHRGDAGGGRQDRARDHRLRGTPRRRVQEEGNQRHRGRQERVPRSGAEDDQADRPRLPAAGLRPHREHEVSGAVAEEEKIIDEEGHVHLHDEAVDLSGTIPEGWLALAIFWALGATVFYQFVTRYVFNDSAAWTEEVSRYMLIGVVFVGATIGVAKNLHIQVDFFSRNRPAALGLWLSRAVDVLRIAFFAAAAVLTVQMMLRIGNQTRMTIVDAPMN